MNPTVEGFFSLHKLLEYLRKYKYKLWIYVWHRGAVVSTVLAPSKEVPGMDLLPGRAFECWVCLYQWLYHSLSSVIDLCRAWAQKTVSVHTVDRAILKCRFKLYRARKPNYVKVSNSSVLRHIKIENAFWKTWMSHPKGERPSGLLSALSSLKIEKCLVERFSNETEALIQSKQGRFDWKEKITRFSKHHRLMTVDIIHTRMYTSYNKLIKTMLIETKC